MEWSDEGVSKGTFGLNYRSKYDLSFLDRKYYFWAADRKINGVQQKTGEKKEPRNSRINHET